MHADEVVSRSSASTEFKEAVRSLGSRDPSPRVRSARRAPAVKLRRIVTYLLWAHPELDVTAVSIDGVSGCSDFTGTIDVTTSQATRTFDFVWDCRWRAEQEGWTDHWGQPDQIRAAHEFDWQCVAEWRERIPAGGGPASP